MQLDHCGVSHLASWLISKEMTPLHKTQLGHSKLMSLQVLLFGTYKWLEVDLLCKRSLTHL